MALRKPGPFFSEIIRCVADSPFLFPLGDYQLHATFSSPHPLIRLEHGPKKSALQFNVCDIVKIRITLWCIQFLASSIILYVKYKNML